MRGTPTTYCQTFFGSHLCKPGEKLLEALFLKLDLSVSRKTAQP